MVEGGDAPTRAPRNSAAARNQGCTIRDRARRATQASQRITGRVCSFPSLLEGNAVWLQGLRGLHRQPYFGGKKPQSQHLGTGSELCRVSGSGTGRAIDLRAGPPSGRSRGQEDSGPGFVLLAQFPLHEALGGFRKLFLSLLPQEAQRRAWHVPGAPRIMPSVVVCVCSPCSWQDLCTQTPRLFARVSSHGDFFLWGLGPPG